MTGVANLRQARKRKGRAEKERQAAANRLSHGRPAADRAAERLGRELDERRLDGHRRESDGEP